MGFGGDYELVIYTLFSIFIKKSYIIL